jgi:hypothetical protein
LVLKKGILQPPIKKKKKTKIEKIILGIIVPKKKKNPAQKRNSLLVFRMEIPFYKSSLV